MIRVGDIYMHYRGTRAFEIMTISPKAIEWRFIDESSIIKSAITPEQFLTAYREGKYTRESSAKERNFDSQLNDLVFDKTSDIT